MLFSSHSFIFLFLPITLFVYHFLGKFGKARYAVNWLVASSLFFYGWWNPIYLTLILASIGVNYALGCWISKSASSLSKKRILTAGIVLNIATISYYKYTNFIIDNLNFFFGTDYHFKNIILPLAISFFTFQQIMYLVDIYRGETIPHSFMHYCLFITFFPQLIAGPIIHQGDVLPQFAKIKKTLDAKNLTIGLTIFSIGLFKKIIIADFVANFSTPVFAATDSGISITFFEAWGAALAYTFQLYFDFSGYSDMAIGLGRMFGILLPINFASPYKSTSIIQFWQSWHKTLSRFLRDYVYIPLGGNRRGAKRRFLNLYLTMLIGGLWHGAGWTFVIWGGLHGFYLVVNHSWRSLGFEKSNSWFYRQSAHLLTFVCVVFAWVLFRSTNIHGASLMVRAMFGLEGFALPQYLQGYLGSFATLLSSLGWDFAYQITYFYGFKQVFTLLVCLGIAFYAPNTQQILANFEPAFDFKERTKVSNNQGRAIRWAPTIAFSILHAILLAFSVLSMGEVQEFLYFQF